jgi:hypothetical protein
MLQCEMTRRKQGQLWGGVLYLCPSHYALTELRILLH